MRVNEGVGVQEIPICLLCGTMGELLYHGLRDRLFDAPGVWSFLRCPQCGLVWLDPRPIDRDMGRLYHRYHTHELDNQRSGLASVREAFKQAAIGALFAWGDGSTDRRLAPLRKALSLVAPVREALAASTMFLGGTEPGSLLDVGAGNGRFLAQMHDLGWKVLGVEPDLEAAWVARERYSVPVVVGTLQRANLPDDSFDAVTVNHVLEHVSNPIQLLRDCRRVLKPEGKLVVMTPNIASWGHHVLKASWRGLEVPRHLYLFSRRALKLCAELAETRIESLRTTARSARWMWASSRLTNRRGNAAPDRRLRTEGLLFQMVEEIGKTLWKNAGEELVLMATKDEKRF